MDKACYPLNQFAQVITLVNKGTVTVYVGIHFYPVNNHRVAGTIRDIKTKYQLSSQTVDIKGNHTDFTPA